VPMEETKDKCRLQLMTKYCCHCPTANTIVSFTVTHEAGKYVDCGQHAAYF